MLRSSSNRAAARLLPPLLLLLLAAAPPAFGAPPEATGPAANPLPEGVDPVDPALGRQIQEMVHEAEEARGLKALRPVAAGTMGQDALRRQMAQTLREEMKPGEIRSQELGLKAFGLIPEAMDLARFLPELMSAEVAGYYDPKRKYLALIRRPELSGPGTSRSTAQDGARDGEDFLGGDMERLVALHELVHALQDQHFDLLRFETADATSDLSAAYSALVEGDATVAMILGAEGTEMLAAPGMAEKLRQMFADPIAVEKAFELPGGKSRMDAPPYVRDSLMFSYLQGTLFSLDVRQAGGQPLLDYAFATDPPRSTEQILHPHKWLGDRDDPVTLGFPSLGSMPTVGAVVSGMERAEGEMGEFGIRQLLFQNLNDRKAAESAAAGWGGDHFTVFDRAGERRLAWLTVWDSEGDAEEFATAARRLGSGWRVERLAPSRVAVLRGAWDEKERAELLPALKGVPPSAPANRRVDFGAIGAKPMGAEDVPYSNPSAIKPSAKGARSADGGTFSFPQDGFEIHVPKTPAGWTVVAGELRASPVAVFNSKLGVSVLVMAMPRRAEMTAELAMPIFEGGFSVGAFGGYKRTRGKARPAPGDGAYAFDFTVESSPQGALRGTGLAVARGEEIFAFVGVGPAAVWPAAEAPIRKILDTLVIVPSSPGGRGSARRPRANAPTSGD